MNIAIVGATGLVGRRILFCLENSKLKINNLYLFASKKSTGKNLKFKNKNVKVLNIADYNNFDFNYAIFSAGATVSKKYAPLFVKKNVTVIDNSSAFRSVQKVPLVVSEVNIDAVKNSKIIANPNCTTMAMMPVLNVLNKLYGLKRLVVSTYQAVSGSGKKGVGELENQVKNVKKNISDLSFSTKGFNFGKKNVYKDIISYNVVPFAGNMLENGYTDEEEKLVNESRKILNIPNLKVSSTCVRVPVFTGHALSVNAEFSKKPNASNIKKTLSKTDGVSVVDLATPLNSVGKPGTFISRIRIDKSAPNALNFWIVADNLLKGAALNAVQILEKII